ncbi:GLUG motif-containing protein, partial [Methanobrevibacter sp. UBA188]
FTNNQVTSGSGGVVCLNGNGEVKNCNFTNNLGGAVYFLEQGNVSNSNFANNSASHASAI